MEHWDPQMMLDLYIHNYLIRKNMHNTAEIFAREANVYPKAVAIDSPEGFLSEWWSLFWSVYSSQRLKDTEATEDSLSKEASNAGNVPQIAHPVMLSPDTNHMLQNIFLGMQRPGLPNLLQTVDSSTMWTPDIANFRQADLSSMMSRAEMKVPVLDFSMMQGQTMQNSIPVAMSEQQHANVPVGDLNSSSQILNVDQLASLLPSSSKSRHPHEKVYKNPQLSFTRDDKCAPSLRKSASDPTRQSPKAIQLAIGSADAGSKMCEQERLRLPVRNLNSNPQILDVDRLARLLPFSSNCSHPQEKVYKKLLLSVAKDDQRGASLWRPIAAEPYHHPPKSIQFNREPADTDVRIREQEFLGLPIGNLNSDAQVLHVDQLASLLPSSSNYSHPQKNKKRHRAITGDDKCGTSLRRSIAAVPTHYAPIVIQPNSEPADTDAKQHEQGRLRLPLRDSNANPQPLDVNQLARLLSSSSNCSQPQKNVDKKSQLSVTRDDSCDTSLRGSAAEPTCHAPKAILPKSELADTGSSTSSNSASSDPSSGIQGLMPKHEAS